MCDHDYFYAQFSIVNPPKYNRCEDRALSMCFSNLMCEIALP